jgi:hypothetical protein
MPCDVCGKAQKLGESISTWAKAGMPLSKIETLQARLNTCKTCEHFKGGVCGKCGCIIFLKARLATSQCPIGKW